MKARLEVGRLQGSQARQSHTVGFDKRERAATMRIHLVGSVPDVHGLQWRANCDNDGTILTAGRVFADTVPLLFRELSAVANDVREVRR